MDCWADWGPQKRQKEEYLIALYCHGCCFVYGLLALFWGATVALLTPPLRLHSNHFVVVMLAMMGDIDVPNGERAGSTTKKKKWARGIL